MSYHDKLRDYDPESLLENPWNPNVVDPVNQHKLQRSLEVDGLQKAILVRTLKDGSRQIIDGQHRVLAARALGWDTVPCVDLGDISDGEAKKHTIIGNQRYGADDVMLMANLLSDESIGSAADLIATLPFDEATLEGYFQHLTIDLDDLENLGDIDDSDDLGVNLPSGKSTRTHQILRFKVTVEDATNISDLVTRTKHAQGFTESDDLTNAGDALVYLFSDLEQTDD